MKKFICVILCVIFALSCMSFSVFAEDETYTSLGKYIKENGWPEYICAYYYSQSGYDPNYPDNKPQSEIVIYVNEGTSESNLEMIKSIIDDFDTVTFRNSSKSRAYYENLIDTLKKDERIGEYIWYAAISMKYDDTLLYLNIYKENYDEVMSVLKLDYIDYMPNIEAVGCDKGDFTGVPEGSYSLDFKYDPVITGDYTHTNAGNGMIIIYACIVVFALLVSLAIVFIYRKRRIKLNTNADTVSVDMENDDIIEKIKEGNEPDEIVYSKMIEKIENDK